MNGSTDLPSCESAENPRHRCLGPVIPGVVLGLMSFVVAFALLTSSKTGAPADGDGPVTNNTEEQPAESTVASIDQEPDPKPDPQPDPDPLPPESIAFAGKNPTDEWSANGLRMKFCWCPAGAFIMGSPKDEKEREPPYCEFSENQVEVKLTKGFWLAQYETTQGQWEKVTGTTLKQQLDKENVQRWEAYQRNTQAEEVDWAPSSVEGLSYPMYYVNHAEATAFCQKLAEQERKAGRLPRGWEYRLPTDAQWEYACRAGTKTATAFGDRLSSKQANVGGGLPYDGAEKGPFLGQVTEVGRHQPNAWGLYDMHGNAREWCRDCYQTKSPGGTDPEVTTSPHSTNGEADRVVRGGSWRTYGSDCRSARRYGSAPATRDSDFGFRVAIVLPDPKPKPAPQPDPIPLPKGTLINSIGMKLAPIPAGKFLMGSPKDEPGRPLSGLGLTDYEEQHEVTLREPFYLGIYLVTQEQYLYVMGESPRYSPSYCSHEGAAKERVKEFKDTKRFPMDTVSWDAAREFCRRLSDLPEEKTQNRLYRLPTEAEWEYACRAGTTTRYYFGNTISTKQANFDNLGRTTPVGHYANPNKFGLYDMHGNLWEWCEDVFGPYQKDLGNPRNETSRVMRGGSFVNYGRDCRSASRSGNSCNYRHCSVGFRVALSVGARSP